MFRRWPFSLTLKEVLKNFNPLQSYRHFSKLLPSKSQNTPNARARRVILGVARSERHSKTLRSFFVDTMASHWKYLDNEFNDSFYGLLLQSARPK